MINKIKNLETFFRQYGIEGEDAFLVLSVFYLRIHNPNKKVASKNMLFFWKKGESLLNKLKNDLLLIEQLESYFHEDIKGESLPVAYQYFLSKNFRDNTGKFFTPKEVAEAMANMLPIKEGSYIFDPTCGGGTFLLSAIKRWGDTPLTIIGNDIDKLLVYLSELLVSTNSKNNAFHFSNLNLYNEFSELKKWYGKIDYILANPPFSLKIKSMPVESQLFNSGYTNSDAVFIDLCQKLLKPNGKLVCLLPHSLVANKEFLNFRKMVEENWAINGVFILPEGVFYTTSNTTTRADVVILKKGAFSQNTDKIVFGNVNKVGVPITAREKKPIKNDLKDVVDMKKVKLALVR